MRRDGHNGAGPVISQHVIGGPHGNPFAVDRIDRVPAEEDAGLLPLGGEAVDVGEAPHLVDVRLECGTLLRSTNFCGQR